MPAVPCTANYTIDPISVETGSIVRPDDLKAILETLRSQFSQLILYTTPVDKSWSNLSFGFFRFEPTVLAGLWATFTSNCLKFLAFFSEISWKHGKVTKPLWFSGGLFWGWFTALGCLVLWQLLTGQRIFRRLMKTKKCEVQHVMDALKRMVTRANS